MILSSWAAYEKTTPGDCSRAEFNAGMASRISVREGVAVIDDVSNDFLLHLEVVDGRIPGVTPIGRGSPVAQLELPGALRI